MKAAKMRTARLQPRWQIPTNPSPAEGSLATPAKTMPAASTHTSSALQSARVHSPGVMNRFVARRAEAHVAPGLPGVPPLRLREPASIQGSPGSFAWPTQKLAPQQEWATLERPQVGNTPMLAILIHRSMLFVLLKVDMRLFHWGMVMSLPRPLSRVSAAYGLVAASGIAALSGILMRFVSHAP